MPVIGTGGHTVIRCRNFCNTAGRMLIRRYLPFGQLHALPMDLKTFFVCRKQVSVRFSAAWGSDNRTSMLFRIYPSILPAAPNKLPPEGISSFSR